MFKVNISEKSGKTYKLETENEEVVGKELHDKVDGKIFLPDLEGYELEITGASDKAGFTAMKEVEGVGLKRVLLGYGKAMHKRPRKEGKKMPSNPKPKGLRMRKTVRGKVISPDIVQINLKVIKEGAKKLADVFGGAKEGEVKPEEPSPETNRAGTGKEEAGTNSEEKPAEGETPTETKPADAENNSESK